MSTLEGLVESVRKDGRGFKFEDGNWYSSYNPLPKDVQRGVKVRFDFAQKGQYKNIQGNVQVLGGMPQAQDSGGTASGGMLPVSLDRQRAIIRQNALTNAVNYFAQFTTEPTPDDVLEVAKQFEAYTTGDADLEDAKGAFEDGFNPEG